TPLENRAQPDLHAWEMNIAITDLDDRWLKHESNFEGVDVGRVSNVQADISRASNRDGDEGWLDCKQIGGILCG
ncbi:hypothetical protein D6833_00850, partial [Candidatus Parcubacteria bacterium]